MKGVRCFEHTRDALEEEARLLARVAGGHSNFEMILWTAGRSLVAPSAIRRNSRFESAARDSAARGWPLVLRPSGGGIVPQGQGILNLAIVSVAHVGKAQDPVAFYRVLTDLIGGASGRAGAVSVGSAEGSFCDGKYNVAIDGRKLTGTAQRWTLRRSGSGDYAVLAHAVILCSADIRASCAAIEDFGTDLGVPAFPDPAVHINLQEVLPQGCDALTHCATVLGDHAQETDCDVTELTRA